MNSYKAWSYLVKDDIGPAVKTSLNACCRLVSKISNSWHLRPITSLHLQLPKELDGRYCQNIKKTLSGYFHHKSVALKALPEKLVLRLPLETVRILIQFSERILKLGLEITGYSEDRIEVNGVPECFVERDVGEPKSRDQFY